MAGSGNQLFAAPIVAPIVLVAKNVNRNYKNDDRRSYFYIVNDAIGGNDNNHKVNIFRNQHNRGNNRSGES